MINMTDELISVIVPVYNGKQYIGACMRSIVNQTYKNLEIILVDDGSLDGSAEICDAWKDQDSRVRVIHQKNGGLSHARNSGMRLASGKYIAFVDIDDLVHPQMYETLHAIAVRYGLDMAVCKYQSIHSGDICFEPYDLSELEEKAEIFTGEQALEGFIEYYQTRIRIPVWCKLYNAEKIKAIGFVEGRIHEDEFLIHHIVGSCDKIGITDAVMYFYYLSEDSITRSDFTIKHLDFIYGLRDRFFYFKERGITGQANSWGEYYIRQVLSKWHFVRNNQSRLADYYRENCLKLLDEDRQALGEACRLSPAVRLQLKYVYRYPAAVDVLSYTLLAKAYRRLKGKTEYNRKVKIQKNYKKA